MPPLRPPAPRLDAYKTIAQRYPDIDLDVLGTCIEWMKLTYATATVLDGHYARMGLSRGRFHVLMQLWKSDASGLSPAELAERAAVTRAAMTGLVDGLVEDGMVAREADAIDGRTYRVRLTDKAHTFLRRILPDHWARLQRLASGLSASEQKALGGLVDKLWMGLQRFETPVVPVGSRSRAKSESQARARRLTPQSPQSAARSTGDASHGQRHRRTKR